MKRIICSLVAVAALMVCASTHAQTATTPAATSTNTVNRRAAAMEKMMDELGVTSDQKQKLTDVFKAQNEKRMALRDDTAITDDVRRDKMKELMADTKTKVSGILTPDQFTKWQKMMQDRLTKLRGNAAPPSDK